jgi:thioredoxin reductase (NADPH)
MLVRRDGLSATMSSYLVSRIEATSNIKLHAHTEIVELLGDNEGLCMVRVRDAREDVERDFAVRHLFLFIGADPNTGWLDGSGIALDRNGFILTGQDAGKAPGDRPRKELETSLGGVFAIGDVRAGSTKRVAAAVGEGAAAVAQIHAFLADAPSYQN